MPDNVVICGGGVIGGAIAYYLSLRGVAPTIRCLSSEMTRIPPTRHLKLKPLSC